MSFKMFSRDDGSFDSVFVESKLPGNIPKRDVDDSEAALIEPPNDKPFRFFMTGQLHGKTDVATLADRNISKLGHA